ncbi:hypothetical protein CVS40_4835 [Lucilia cuprina]|nr:hypothetical protein CVS40_4835 [Lucilia cuprina]
MVGNRATPGSHTASENHNNGNIERINIRVDKWGILYNGNNSQLSIEDFIFRIKHLQAHFIISWDEILRDFHLLVTGPAKDWYFAL